MSLQLTNKQNFLGGFPVNFSKLSDHSEYLRQYFPISEIGVDYYNPYDIAIEFKETIKTENLRFAISENRLKDSDYVCFCFRDKEFFLMDIQFLKDHYTVNKKYGLVFIREKTIREKSLVKTNSLKTMREFIDSLEGLI